MPICNYITFITLDIKWNIEVLFNNFQFHRMKHQLLILLISPVI